VGREATGAGESERRCSAAVHGLAAQASLIRTTLLVAVADEEAVTEPDAEALVVDVSEGDAVCSREKKTRERTDDCDAQLQRPGARTLFHSAACRAIYASVMSPQLPQAAACRRRFPVHCLTRSPDWSSPSARR
jgi:hypothetical protein